MQRRQFLATLGAGLLTVQLPGLAYAVAPAGYQRLLVLVNGKRRHGTSNLAVLGGPYQGAATADLDLELHGLGGDLVDGLDARELATLAARGLPPVQTSA